MTIWKCTIRKLKTLRATYSKLQLIHNQHIKLSTTLNKRAQNILDAQKGVKSKWSKDVKDANTNLQTAQRNADAHFGDAQKDIRDKQKNVDDLQGEIDKIDDKITKRTKEANKNKLKWIYIGPEIAGLKIERGLIVASKDVATLGLDIAKGFMSGTQYITDQGLIKDAEDALGEVDHLGELGLDFANSFLTETQEAGDKVIGLADNSVTFYERVLNDTVKALDDFKKGSSSALKSLNDAVIGLVNTAEYIAYKAASEALDLAQKTQEGILEGFEYAVAKAGEGARLAKRITKYIADGLIPFEIQSVTLSGHLQGLIHHGELFQATIVFRAFDVQQTIHTSIGLNFSKRKRESLGIPTSTKERRGVRDASLGHFTSSQLSQTLYEKAWTQAADLWQTADCSVEACLDFVFCIDTTLSMGDDINDVKINMDKINRELFIEYEVDTRAAVVNYRDFANRTGKPYDFPYQAVLPFSRSIDDVHGALQSLTLGHGGDFEETVYYAIIESLRGTGIGPWRKNAQKVIMVIGDAPPLDPEPFSGYTMDSVMRSA